MIMLIHNYDSDMEKSVFDQICESELEMIVLKFGSLITMLSGKTTSVVYVFNFILNNPPYRDLLCKISECEWIEIANYFVRRYPILAKSKKIQQEELDLDT